MDHRKNTSLAYDPDYLTTNFFEERCQREHKQRLREMKPYIDSRTNKTMNMPHLRTRLKKRMMDRHQRDRVEHENRLLLNRLSHIMRTKQVDDTHRKEYTSNVHLRTLAIQRQFKWNRIAEENERMGRRIQNVKSAYSRKKLKDKRKKEQKTPAANSRLTMPWTLGSGVSRIRKTASWNKNQKQERRNAKARAKLGVDLVDGSRMMPSIAFGFEQSPQSAKAPFLSVDTMGSSMGRLPSSAPPASGYNSSLMAATTPSAAQGRPLEGQSRAMAAWEEIKSWSLWDMPLQQKRSVSDMDLRLTRNNTLPGSMQKPRSPGRTLSPLDATYDSFSRSMSPLHGARTTGEVAYDSHDKLKHKARRVTKPHTGAGTRYIGGDVVLLRSARTMNDGAKWALAAVEVGQATKIQDDVMAGFRIDGKQEKGGPSVSLELTVDDVKELASNWDDRIIASVLGRCRVVPKTNGRLYTRMTSLKVTDIGHNVTAQQWEDESNRARFLRRRFGKFLLERVVVDMSGDLLRLDMDWNDPEEDPDDRVTWKDMPGEASTITQGETATDASTLPSAREGAGAGGGGADGEQQGGAAEAGAGSNADQAGPADAGADGSSGPSDADKFVVEVTLMAADTGAAVAGANVVVQTRDGQVLAQGESNAVGQCTFQCVFHGWRDTGLVCVATGDAGEAGEGGEGEDFAQAQARQLSGETGLLCAEDTNVVDATVLMANFE